MPIPSDIADLAAAVPSPPGESLPNGASEHEIDAFERRTGIAVPPELSQWWAFTNGPCIGPGGIYGVQPDRKSLDVESRLSAHPQWLDLKWIPIAGDGCGNEYLLITDADFGTMRPICFYDHEDGTADNYSYTVASSLWNFLRFLLQSDLGERRWPFDRDYVLRSDPQLGRCSKLPWEARA